MIHGTHPGPPCNVHAKDASRTRYGKDVEHLAIPAQKHFIR
jgi:hypothetical protein